MDDVLVERLKGIAHPMRLAILRALGEGEANVGQIEQATGIGQPALSQQLSVLRGVGLVSTRRQSKLVFYALDATALAESAAAVSALLPASARPAPAGTSTPAPHRSRSGAAVFATVSGISEG